jgi:hypothetical protein
MTIARATAYFGAACLLAAWAASASWLFTRPVVIEQPRAVPTSGTESLGAVVQEQGLRLRAHLSAAPRPLDPVRNPFAFAVQRTVIPEAATPRSAASAPPAVPEPLLELVGVAEQQTPKGVVRTAMITADGPELFMLVEGDSLGGRYRVKSVGADTVELTDLVTGANRRLALR